MTVLTILLALLSAFANGAASVLQRRAAMEQKSRERQEAGKDPDGAQVRPESERARDGPGRWRGTARRSTRATAELYAMFRHPLWLAGVSAMIVSGAAQTGALAVGRLSVVQPLLASELLFTLVVGSVVFHHRPDGRTWLAFLMLAAGLGVFLAAASPSLGQDVAKDGHWLPLGLVLAPLVGALLFTARRLRGAARAAVLGMATAICFSCTAALLKETTGRASDGLAALLTGWQLYVTGAVGLLSFLLLQNTFRAGTLVASQPALTLGDALVSVVLGWTLFGERIALGLHILPEAAGACLIAMGTVGLTRSPVVAGGGDATSTEFAASTEEGRGTGPGGLDTAPLSPPASRRDSGGRG